MMKKRTCGACLLVGLLVLLLAAPAQAVTLQTTSAPDVWGPLANPLKTAEVRVIKGDGGFTGYNEVAIYNHDAGTSSGRTVAWNTATDPVYSYTLSRTGDTITFTWADSSNPPISWSYGGFGDTLYDRFVYGAASSNPDLFNAHMDFTNFKAWDENGALMELSSSVSPWGAYTTSNYGTGSIDVYKMINSIFFDDGSGNPVAFRDFEITGTFNFSGDLDAASGEDFGVYFAFDKVNPTPLPAAVWLLGSGLAGLVGLRRKMGA